VQVGEDKIYDGAANIGERVAVEEKERRAAMALPQELYGFGERADFELESAPLSFNRRIAL